MGARRIIRALRYLPSDLALMSGPAGGLRFWRARHWGGAGTTCVRPRALRGESIAIRRGTTDAQVAWYVLSQRAQLLPSGHDALASIVDLGANIGVSAALFAVLNPEARILAVEPDADNAELCRANTLPWRDRCTVVEAAVWASPGEVHLVGNRPDSLRVQADATSGGRKVDTIATAELIERAAVRGRVDFVKMNVEGTEAALLREPEWLSSVDAIRVEVHPPYSIADCAADLEAAGFAVRRPASDDDPWVTGVRAAQSATAA